MQAFAWLNPELTTEFADRVSQQLSSDRLRLRKTKLLRPRFRDSPPAIELG